MLYVPMARLPTGYPGKEKKIKLSKLLIIDVE
jgi:hypothetical protein